MQNVVAETRHDAGSVQKRAISVFFVCVVSCCLFTVLAFSLVCATSTEPSVPFVTAFVRMLALGAGYLLLTTLFLSNRVSLFRFDYRAGRGERELAQRLEKIGKLPSQAEGVVLFMDVVYLLVVACLASWIGILDAPVRRIPVLCLCLVWGLLAGGIVYFVMGRLVTRFLLALRIVDYPRTLRVSQQRRRLFILPLSTLVMGLLYAGAAALILVEESKDGSLLGGNGLPLELGALAVFFGVMCVMLRLESNDTGAAFGSVISQLEQLSSDDKDLSDRVCVGTVDELGTIAGLVNDFTAGLAGSIATIKAAQHQLNTVGADLSRSAESSATAVTQISASMDRMQEKSRGQESSVGQTSTAVEEIAREIESLDHLISDQAASVTEASASIEEMVGNISSINTSMATMAAEFTELTRTAGLGSSTQEESGRRIAEIATRSQDLAEANTVIASIASQTNLLAMNAAIEAAHAGSAGKGFAVVADEIRKLAEDSAENSRRIRTVLADVQTGIDSVVEASNASKDAFSEVSDRIGTTDRLVREITAAISEQETGASQVLTALKQMNDSTAEVKTGAGTMNHGADTILDEIAKLRTAAGQIAENMEDMHGGIAAVNKQTALVASTARKTQATIDQLNEAVGSFKTEA